MATVTKKSVYQIVTDKIIALLEQGVCPWQPSFISEFGNMAPQNYESKRAYRGINFFLLKLANPNPYYLTFRQVQKQGGRIKKGSKSLPVFFWKFQYFDLDGKKVKTEKEATTKVGRLLFHRVFNAADVVGIDFDYPNVQILQDHQRIECCEKVVSSTKASLINKGSQPVFIPSEDRIEMPKLSQYKSAELYYHDLFHELTHWSGHPSRLNRFKPAPFGSKDYSKEELIAEMGASFLSHYCQITDDEIFQSSASYLQSWITLLKGDSKLIVSAATQAQKAFDYIINFQS